MGRGAEAGTGFPSPSLPEIGRRKNFSISYDPLITSATAAAATPIAAKINAAGQ